ISCCIDEELDKLDNLTREVIILHFLEGQNMTDIAEKFGISQPTVSRRIESGIDSLRQKLKSRGVILTAAMLSALLTENIVQAAPASIMRELGKIAIAGSKATIGAEIASTISTIAAVKMKLIAGIMIVLAGAGLTVIFSFIANGENKPASIWELVTKPQEKESQENQPQEKQPEPDNKITKVKTVNNNADITASELLAKYTQVLESTKSFISKSEFSYTYDSNFGKDAPMPMLMNTKEKGGKFQMSEIRYDGERTHIQRYTWNEPNPPKESRIRDKAGDFKLNNFADGENYRHSTGIVNEGPAGLVMINKTAYYMPDSEETYQGYYLFGDERVDEVLGNATNISLRSATEKIGDSDCYVIDVQTKYGKLSIWIDPAHGYQNAKVELLATEGDFPSSGPGKLRKGQSSHKVIHFGQFKQIDGIWVPMEYRQSTRHILGPDGYSSSESHHKRTEFILNPDHDALGSFDSPLRNPEQDTELRNGTPVHIAYLNKRLNWQDGKLLDGNGEVFDIDNIKPVSLLGKALPNITQVRLDPDAIKDKKLLICFWNMDNNESIKCIKTLNKKAMALLDTRDVYMVFMHAGSLSDEIFFPWISKNEILPPAGYHLDSLDGLQYSWGVKSIPWLILTDKNHIVIAEGFSITDLDEKIKD
ncbi:MAG: hypothetical protein JXA96_03935, partial [Sedimentisphaerales bacterium]|nr:hypothetical protein [Sedimentisphaerales bacterium]